MKPSASRVRHTAPLICRCCAQGNFLSVYIRTTLIDCTIGVPGLSIPIGLAADKLPIGIMLQGKPGMSLDSPHGSIGTIFSAGLTLICIILRAL